MKSIYEQIRSMEADWPQFLVAQYYSSQSAIWFGWLKPTERRFLISIAYGTFEGQPRYAWEVAPTVRVLWPFLRPNFQAAEEKPLPHVYFDFPDIRFSKLCLFVPQWGQWNSSMYISETIVPWTRKWLRYYEDWEVTGKWRGGGVHQSDLEKLGHQPK